MSTEPESIEEETPPAFAEYNVTVDGLGTVTVIDPEGEPGYRVRLLDGRVTAFAAVSGNPSPENAATDIAHAIANPPPPPVPAEISRARFVIAARRVLGVTEGAVFALISGLPAGEEQEMTRDLWENAVVFRRSNPFLGMLAQAGGYTSEQIDEVFRVGGALQID